MSARSSETRNGKRRKSPNWATDTGWQGFVDINLTAGERDDLEGYVGEWSPGALAAFLSLVLDDGYKLSLSPDPAHNCVIATLTGTQSGCANRGFSLSARGPDGSGALLALWYKHVRLCECLAWSMRSEEVTRQMPLWG